MAEDTIAMEKSELYAAPQDGIAFTVAETTTNIDSMHELYRLLQEGMNDVENGRTKSMKESLNYIREKIN